MIQALSHRHADLISLSGTQNVGMDSIDPHRKKLGWRVRRLRLAKGWTAQADLATAAKVSQPTVSDLEGAKTKEPTASLLVAVSAALETTVEYLWNCDDEPHDGNLAGLTEEALRALDLKEQAAQLLDAFNKLDERGRNAVVSLALTEAQASTPDARPSLRVIRSERHDAPPRSEVPPRRASLQQGKRKPRRS